MTPGFIASDFKLNLLTVLSRQLRGQKAMFVNIVDSNIAAQGIRKQVHSDLVSC